YQMAYGLRGTVYERMGEKSNAVSDYKKATDYGSNAALECLDRLGITYTSQKPSSSGGSPQVQISRDGSIIRNNISSTEKKEYTEVETFDPNTGKWNKSRVEVITVPKGFTGRGKTLDNCGFMYEGDFVNGWRHGKGKLTMANGNFYEGDFADNWYHGYGRLTYVGGGYEEGYWRGGRFLGNGIIGKLFGKKK
ncbi:MAG: hypothetical protein FWB95_09100, partial [Treponema sp.]|nr:hypothetical protein [Treponema sp.]